MSRTRTRPTRDDTRDKLFDAAARVFEEQGINAASIETIAAAAGFTRGAFYSNFASKEELIVAMLEDHVEQSIRRNLDLLAKHQDLQDYLDAYRKMGGGSRQDPLGHAPLLHMEMILFVARAEKRRPELAKRLRARRQMLTEIVAIISKHEGKNFENPSWVAAILLALEDGFRLHRLIDPETTPPDSFLRALNDLQEAIGNTFDVR
jgi:AcrR family transcriptional regulator